MKPRIATLDRETKETRIRLELRLDGPAATRVSTGIPFLDHMMDALACHGRFGLEVEAQGDLHVDPHHLVEDCGIALGFAAAKALEGSGPVARAGCFSFPMDGSLAQVAIDLCGRPNLVWQVPLESERVGDVDPRLFRDFLKGFADGARATVHVFVPYRDNDHHALEAVFKALGRALREAVRPADGEGPLSTKGVLDA